MHSCSLCRGRQVEGGGEDKIPDLNADELDMPGGHLVEEEDAHFDLLGH